MTDPGYVFTGWTVNGTPAKQTTGPLVLTMGTGFAGKSGVLPGGTAEVQANCFSVTITAPDTVKRDEIFDVTLTVNPPPVDEITITFDLSGQKTQNLPGRGDVQMYDFGYDTDGDGDIDPGQTSYTFNPAVDGGMKTITAVYNLYQPSQTIKVVASVDGQTFESAPIVVTYQIRQYTTQYNQPAIDALEGPEKDRAWNWSVLPVGFDPEKGDLYNVNDSSPYMNFPIVILSSQSLNLHVGG